MDDEIRVICNDDKHNINQDDLIVIAINNKVEYITVKEAEKIVSIINAQLQLVKDKNGDRKTGNS